jgi:hypothetical protein
MGDRPPWWKVEPPPPVNPAIICPPSRREQKKPNTKSSPEVAKTAEGIQRTVKEHYGVLRQCYQRTLARDPTVEGRVSVRFAIEPTGEVSSACVSYYGIPDGVLIECVVDTFKSLRFEKPDKLTTVVYPVFFQVAK